MWKIKQLENGLVWQVCTLLLVSFLTAPLFADDWPQWMGPQRDGVWRETGIELTVEEHLLHDYYDSKKYYDAGIDVVNLSADNLTASVLHMDDQLMGNAMESQLEHDQQKYFWQMMEAHYKKRGHSITVHPEARISPSFLRQLKLPTKVI